MARLLGFLIGAGSLVVGGLSRFTAIQLPIDCRGGLFAVAGTVITVDMILMGGGALLLFLALVTGSTDDY